MQSIHTRTNGRSPGLSSRMLDFPLVVWLGVGAATLLAAVLRLHALDSQGIILDESFSIYLSRVPFAEFKHIIWHSELNMALYYLLLRGWIHLGQSEGTIRALGVIFSAATVPVVYGLGSRLFDRGSGLIAAFLLAIHPYHVMLAQRARSYPLVVLLVSLSSLCFVQAVRRPTSTRWLFYAVVSAAAVYSHFFAILVILTQLVSLVTLRTTVVPWRSMLCALALLAALLLPFGVFMATNSSTIHVDWIPDPDFGQFLRLLYSLTLSKSRMLVYLLLWSVAAYAWWRASQDQQRWAFRFAFAWLLLPLALGIAASFRHPLLIERYYSVCIPATVLLAAVGGVCLWSRSRAAAIVALLLLVIYSASAIRFYVRHPEFAEGWREGSRWILQHAQSGDAVIAEGLAGLTFDYYHDTFEGAPRIRRLDSFEAPLPSPSPVNVWLLGSIRFNPNWKGAVQGATESAVQRFAEAHRHEYCAEPVNYDAGETRVWHFIRCLPGASATPTVW